MCEKVQTSLDSPHHMPEDWQPTKELRLWAEKERPDLPIDEIIPEFIHYWTKGAGKNKKSAQGATQREQHTVPPKPASRRLEPTERVVF